MTTDLFGNTPLHSAIRYGTTVEALHALIHAYPEALDLKTEYDDTVLHLACLRNVDADVICELAHVCDSRWKSNDRRYPILAENIAGQTPFGIVMESYRRLSYDSCSTSICRVKSTFSPELKRLFQVLSTFIKILYYGSDTDIRTRSLIIPCLSLHRTYQVRIDPVFIHRVLRTYPEEAMIRDEETGNYPLHYEASIPIEKMTLLDGPSNNVLNCFQQRISILPVLMELYPGAAKQQNKAGTFPLSLMIQNGRNWDTSFALMLRTNPQALHWINNFQKDCIPRMLHKVGNHCGIETVFDLLSGRPDIVAPDSFASD